MCLTSLFLSMIYLNGLICPEEPQWNIRRQKKLYTLKKLSNSFMYFSLYRVTKMEDNKLKVQVLMELLNIRSNVQPILVLLGCAESIFPYHCISSCDNAWNVLKVSKVLHFHSLAGRIPYEWVVLPFQSKGGNHLFSGSGLKIKSSKNLWDNFRMKQKSFSYFIWVSVKSYSFQIYMHHFSPEAIGIATIRIDHEHTTLIHI